MGAVTSQVEIDLFQAANQRQDLVSLDGAARTLAEMGPAPEGTRFINQAFSRIGLKHGTRPLRMQGQGFSAGSPEGLGGEEGFAAGQLGNFAGKPKLAAFRPPEAVSLDRPTGKLRVNGTDFRKRRGLAFHGEIAQAAMGSRRKRGVRIWAGPAWP